MRTEKSAKRQEIKLQALINHFFGIYGRRNRIYLSGLRKRIDFLNIAVGDLQDAIRKQVGLAIPLARVVARIFCIAENFINLPLVEMMARKYPPHCAYCGFSPCRCQEKRHEATLLNQANTLFLNWNLSNWQIHLNILYADINNRRGINYIMGRLFKEVTELLSLQMSVSHLHRKEMPVTLKKIEEEFALELSDTLAWTIAVANFYQMDLEIAVLDRYGKGCPTCLQTICSCLQFDYNAIKWPQK